MVADEEGGNLAAHRTFNNDIVGRVGTFVISTLYKGHENIWRLDRVGDLERHRYIITVRDSKCVKDMVNQIDWAITAQIPHEKCDKTVIRDENSRYVYVMAKECKA